MIISASQINTRRACRRKWWFEKKAKVKRISKHSAVVGDALHAVCERYLRADDLGRDANGDPVELYPDGWHIPVGRYGKPEGVLTPADQAMIQAWIPAAIEEGILERRPGRQVEREFPLLELLPNMYLTGMIDVDYPDAIEDHKTVKNTRYAKNKNTLGDDLQMLLYWGVKIRERIGRGEDLPDTCSIRHNQYIKEPKPAVRKVEVEVPRKRVLKEWEKLYNEDLPQFEAVSAIKTWNQVPCNRDACNDYGGCPFATVCDGKESLDALKERMQTAVAQQQIRLLQDLQRAGAELTDDQKKALDNHQQSEKIRVNQLTNKPTSQKGSTMPSPAELLKRAAQAKPQATAPAQATKAEPAQTTKAEPVEGAAPWAQPGCKACDGTGINRKGNPCRICDTKAARNGDPTSADFTIDIEDGIMTYVNNDDPDIAGEIVLEPKAEAKAAQVQVAEKEPEPAPEPETKEEEADDQGDADETQPKKEPAEEEAPAKPEKKPKASKTTSTKKGMILCINCMVSDRGRKGGGRHVHDLHKLIAAAKDEICTAKGVARFEELNAFERRDLLGMQAYAMAEEIGPDMAYVTGIGTGASDDKAVVDVLKGLAEMVIQGVM